MQPQYSSILYSPKMTGCKHLALAISNPTQCLCLQRASGDAMPQPHAERILHCNVRNDHHARANFVDGTNTWMIQSGSRLRLKRSGMCASCARSLGGISRRRGCANPPDPASSQTLTVFSKSRFCYLYGGRLESNSTFLQSSSGTPAHLRRPFQSPRTSVLATHSIATMRGGTGPSAALRPSVFAGDLPFTRVFRHLADCSNMSRSHFSSLSMLALT